MPEVKGHRLNYFSAKRKENGVLLCGHFYKGMTVNDGIELYSGQTVTNQREHHVVFLTLLMIVGPTQWCN